MKLFFVFHEISQQAERIRHGFKSFGDR